MSNAEGVTEGFTVARNSNEHNNLGVSNSCLMELPAFGNLINYRIVLNGYLTPIVILFTIITNSLVCLVLLKPHMRSPTNMLLVAMAMSDTFTGVFPSPAFVYFYMFGHHKQYVPYEWCMVNEYITGGIPTIFHTASIWLTVALAVQRYIYVCHTLAARRWCTVQTAVIGTFIIYIASTICHLSKFVDTYFEPMDCPSVVDNYTLTTTCLPVKRDFFEENAVVFYNVYLWFRIIFIHFIPCTSLIILNALLIKTMRDAKRRRMQLLRQNKKSECKKIQDSNCTTLMLVAVVGVFLVVELPSGIVIMIWVIDETYMLQILTENSIGLLSLFTNFCILVSYPVNFFIYAGMSKQFRDTFKRLFVKGPMPLDREHSQYMSLATENGRTCVTNETTI
ncbi:sex peptide receptor-like [Tubulanus polymorphus]|uniref:sex peptide receptor-like n=1 Tax=Tubulanus polymorphus TaxID=672921 RepID=UPI003DA6592B